MPEKRTYAGGCHCGKVRYEVTTDLERVMQCNCSICSKKGFLLNFVPADKFELLSGKNELVDYQFNTKNVHHLFCRSCGVQSFGTGTGRQGAQVYMVNVRCLDEVELSDFEVTPFDGKSL